MHIQQQQRVKTYEAKTDRTERRDNSTIIVGDFISLSQ